MTLLTKEVGSVLRFTAIALVGAFLVSGCSGGGSAPTTVPPTAAPLPSTHTAALPGVQRVERLPSGGFNLYIDDKLVDAISFAKDGTAEHALAGRRVIDARPSRPARGLQPLIRCTRRDLERAQQAYDSAANYYAANTLLLIGVVGATGVVDALTAGWALLPTAAGVAGAYIAWSTSRSDMYSAYDSMVEMNNGGEC